MADRSVNININYKVNTVDVQAAEAQVKRAQQATNQLQQATQQFGAKGSAAFRSTATSISGMEVELQKLRTLIKLTSTADTQRLASLSAQYKALKARVDAYNKSLLDTNRHSKAASANMRSLAGNVQGLYNAARLFIAASLARELINVSLAAAKLSGNVDGVERAFARLPNSTLLLEDLRAATHGTVSDLELMQRALMAQNFRIPLQQLGTLLEFAAVKAQQTGQEVNHLVDYIISGIGYRSIKRLDDLGFTANRVKEALGGVSLQAASMGDIMDAVSRLMQEDLEKTGGFVKTTKTQVGQLEVAWHELGVAASQAFTRGGFIDVLKEAVQATRFWVQGGFTMEGMRAVIALEEINHQALLLVNRHREENKLLKENERLIATDKRLKQLGESLNILRELVKTDKQRLEQLKTEIPLARERNKSWIGLQKLWAGEAYKALKKLEDEEETLKGNIEERQKNQKVLERAIEILGEYRAALASTNNEETTTLGIVAKKREEIERLEQAINDSLQLGDLGEGGRLTTALAQAQDELNELLGKSNKSLEEWKKNYQRTLEDLIDAEFEWREKRDKLELDSLKNSNDLEDYWRKLRLKKEREAAEEEWKIREALARRRQQLEEDLFYSAIQLSRGLIDLAFQEKESKIEGIREFYDEQIQLAGDNERARKELEIKRDREIIKQRELEKREEKRRAVWRILAETAVNVVEAFPNFVLMGLAASLGAVQAASVRRLKKGAIDLKGGKQGEDSIPALLMPGESVMTREETKDSRNILKAIRAKKLNDQVLKDIVSGRSGGTQVKNIFDDSKIVKEIRDLKNSQGDIVERHGLIMKAQRKSETYTRYVRIKTFGKF